MKLSHAHFFRLLIIIVAIIGGAKYLKVVQTVLLLLHAHVVTPITSPIVSLDHASRFLYFRPASPLRYPAREVA
jgi:hypothetical protein